MQTIQTRKRAADTPSVFTARQRRARAMTRALAALDSVDLDNDWRRSHYAPVPSRRARVRRVRHAKTRVGWVQRYAARWDERMAVRARCSRASR